MKHFYFVLWIRNQAGSNATVFNLFFFECSGLEKGRTTDEICAVPVPGPDEDAAALQLFCFPWSKGKCGFYTEKSHRPSVLCTFPETGTLLQDSVLPSSSGPVSVHFLGASRQWETTHSLVPGPDMGWRWEGADEQLKYRLFLCLAYGSGGGGGGEQPFGMPAGCLALKLPHLPSYGAFKYQEATALGLVWLSSSEFS